MSRIRANLITNQTANGAPNFTNGLFVTGVATVTNNLNVGGVLTYEDVTNVDSIGIITARSGIDTPSNLLLKTGGSERLRINSSGKVGLGTTGSEYSLSIREADNNNKFLMLQKNSGQELLQIREDGNNHIIFDGSHASGELHFYTAGSERLRIASAGQIGIGGANYGTNTSTYNSNTGKSSQVLVSNGGSAAPTWAYTNRPAFMARTQTGTSQTIVTATYTKVNLDFKVLDTDNAFDTTTNRFTVPTGGAGWYMCHFSTGIDDVQDSDYVYARLYLNGSSLNHAIGSGWCSAPNAILQASASHMLHLDDGDYLELMIYHNEGTTEPIEQNRCYFGAFRLNI